MVRPEIVCLSKILKKLDALKAEVLDEIISISSSPLAANVPAAASGSRGRPRGRKKNAKAASSEAANGSLAPVDPREEYTPKEAAPYLGIKLGTLRQEIADNLIEHERDPETKRISITGQALLKRMKERGIENPAN